MTKSSFEPLREKCLISKLKFKTWVRATFAFLLTRRGAARPTPHEAPHTEAAKPDARKRTWNRHDTRVRKRPSRARASRAKPTPTTSPTVTTTTTTEPEAETKLRVAI